MADIITVSRIVCSILILFFPSLSVPFYCIYTYCGASDILDGFVAKKTDSKSKHGAVLDSCADIVFIVVCAVIILPKIEIPSYTLIISAVIGISKIILYIAEYRMNNGFENFHSAENRIIGLLLFVFPYTINLVSVVYTSNIIMLCALVANIAEWAKYLKKRRDK